MAREVCDDSTKADWTSWTYREYRRLLDEEMMAVCQIYAEVKLAELPVREGKEARGWLTSAHKDTECAREHISTRIRSAEELRVLLHLPTTHSKRNKPRTRRIMRPRVPARGSDNEPRVQQTRPDCRQTEHLRRRPSFLVASPEG